MAIPPRQYGHSAVRFIRQQTARPTVAPTRRIPSVIAAGVACGFGSGHGKAAAAATGIGNAGAGVGDVVRRGDGLWDAVSYRTISIGGNGTACPVTSGNTAGDAPASVRLS